jgi:hypothetical protein
VDRTDSADFTAVSLFLLTTAADCFTATDSFFLLLLLSDFRSLLFFPSSREPDALLVRADVPALCRFFSLLRNILTHNNGNDRDYDYDFDDKNDCECLSDSTQPD